MVTNMEFFYKVYKNVNESYVLDQRQSYIVFIPKRTLKNACYSSLIFVRKGILLRTMDLILFQNVKGIKSRIPFELWYNYKVNLFTCIMFFAL